MSRPALSPFPPGQTGLQSTPSFLSSLPGHLSVGQQHQQPGGAGQHGTGASVVTSASNLGLLPGHLEIGRCVLGPFASRTWSLFYVGADELARWPLGGSRQLDGAFDEELRTLEQLGEAFYDELFVPSSVSIICLEALGEADGLLLYVLSTVTRR